VRTNLSQNLKAIVSSKGQVVIPRDLRNALALHDGTELIFSLEGDGSVRFRPVRKRMQDLFGSLARTGERPLSVEEMDEAIAKAITEENP
jgi:antitoxin PrlF